MKPTAPRQRLKKVALVIGSVAFALLISEAGLRFFRLVPEVKIVELGDTANADQCVYRRSKNPVLGFELKANYRNDSPDFIASYERTNEHGQRDVDRDLSSDKRRILLLGDSVVEGYGLPFADTIGRQLEQLYAVDSSQPAVEVLNFGVSAYCTAAEVELLATKGVLFKPNTVVLIFVENDFDNFNREAFPLGQSIERPAFAEWSFRNSHLARLTFLQLNLFQVRAEVDPVQWNSVAIGDNNVVRGLARFRELATEYGFQPVIAIWPRFEQNRLVDPHPIPNEGQLIVEALAKSNGLRTFRMSDHFRRELAKHKGASPRLLFSQGDELHPSALGAHVAARAIHAELEVTQAKTHVGLAATSQSEEVSAQLATALETVSARSPSYARVHNRIGDQQLKAGHLAAAIESYRRALAEEPDNAASHNNLGIALERTDTTANKSLAIDHYRQATASQPDFAEAHFNLGRVLKAQAQNSEQMTEARTCLIQAVKLRPDFLSAHFELSHLLALSGRSRAAEAGLKRVLQLEANHVGAVRLLANELAKQQRFGEAREFYEKLVSLEPRDAEALNNLGAICSLLSDRNAAIKHLEAAVAIDPNHPKAAENLRRLRE